MNKFYLKTFGCKLNQYESQLIRENLILNSWVETDILKEAGRILINSCAVTAEAEKELKKFVRFVKRKNPNLTISVLGCLTDLYPEHLQDLLPLELYTNREKLNLAGELTTKDSITYFKNHTRAFVKIQDGCDNRCSFCCASIARGKPYSRPSEQIVSEIKVLLDNGHKEIVLTGLCLGFFGKDISSSLTALLKQIEDLDYDFRLRLSSIEPQDVDGSLISFMKNSNKLMPHMHLPLQSGSDKILKLMNRKYDSSYFKNIVSKLKEIENFQFSTDIIVGFPQEEDIDFENTLDMLKELMPARVHIFPFSPRPGTKAIDLSGKITAVDIRIQQALETVKYIVYKNLETQLGSNLSMLVERRRDSFWSGYSDSYVSAKFQSSKDYKNKVVAVKALQVDRSDISLICKVMPA